MVASQVPTDAWHDQLRATIVARKARLGVLGQGYVGLTLAAAAAEAGFTVIGVDVDATRVAALAEGHLTVPGVDEDTFAAGVASGNLTFTSDPAAMRGADVMMICVPTPLRDNSPDLSYVEAAANYVATNIERGTLVVLESTTYPGTTDGLVRDIIEGSGLKLSEDYLLAYSPERIDPGNAEFTMRNTPRIVGGATPESLAAAVAFYEQVVDKVVPLSSTRAAETAKLLENTFRHVNIALVNELAMLSHELGIDVWEVIHAAETKPYGFMAFHPGPGVGGHCIPLDPTYLAWQVRRESGRRFAVLEQAQDINDRMPNYVASRVGGLLNEAGLAIKGAKILILGVAYKADIGDVRESPALRVLNLLHKKGAIVTFHDFFVEEVPVNGGLIRRSELDECLPDADCVVLLTPHSAYDLDEIADRARIVFDTRDAYGSRRPANVVPL